MLQSAGYIGRQAVTLFHHITALAAFTRDIFSAGFRRPAAGGRLVRRIIVEQVYGAGVQMLPILIPVALIIGGMLIVQFSKVSEEYNLARTTILLVVRELGPLVTGLLLILKSATAMTIEISHMNSFHEIDALEMAGVDPMRVICLPRLAGAILSLLCLFVVFDIAAIVGGYFLVWLMAPLPAGNFLQQIAKAVSGADIAVGAIKAVFFGVAIAAVCLYHGFAGEKRITAIPLAASRASVECFFFCLLLNVMISAMFYL